MMRSNRHGGFDFRDLNVLVVEDETYARELTCYLMRSFGCPLVAEATNGNEAVDAMMAATRSFGLVICDFRMPVMNGLELLKRIRVGLPGVARDTAFAMLTSHADKPIVGLAFRLDVDCYLAKPITAAVIRNRVTRVMTTDRLIKGPFDYTEVDVDGAMDLADLPEPAAPRIDVNPGPGVVVKPSGSTSKPRDRTSAATPTKSAEPAGRRVGLSQVPVGAVLAAPILTGNGQLLVPNGTSLDKRTLERLKDLAELDSSVKSITIE